MNYSRKTLYKEMFEDIGFSHASLKVEILFYLYYSFK